ncbi:MAG: DUF4139 domain-containing protein [Polyangiaceae bacterium]|nr:DUF4139 domain-containing protein [Polyangiaceae bacterium]
MGTMDPAIGGGPGQSADERAPLPSSARAVTFFEDRAEVVRAAKVNVTPGAQRAAIGGVSAFVDERTVQARVVAGGAEVAAARVRWRAHREAALGREAIEALEREARAAADREAAAGLALARAARREAQAAQLLWKWAGSLAAAPRGARAAEVLAAWRDGLGAIDAAASDALRAAAEARAARAAAEDDRRRAAARLREGSIERPRFEAVIEVELAAAEAGEVQIEVTYRVACALWRPEHLARLREAGSGAEGAPRGARPGAPDVEADAAVDLVTWATAWQASGEAWDHVTARFSTARPAQRATPPRIADDVLRLRKRSAEERSRVVVEAREQEIVAAGLDRGARAVDEMPGVDDGGEPVVFEAPHPVSFPSDGRPVRVEVARRALRAELALVLYPEVHAAAHVRATMTLAERAAPAPAPGDRPRARPAPLLAGPIRVARGQSLVGRARVDFIGAGEPFELGFGTDDAVRVRRAVEEERETSSITGSRKLRRRVKVHLSNLSGDPKRLLVTERIPVSEVADVEIALGEAPGWSLDAKDGLVRARVDLAPNETRTASFSYEIRASGSVVLPF